MCGTADGNADGNPNGLAATQQDTANVWPRCMNDNTLATWSSLGSEPRRGGTRAMSEVKGEPIGTV